MTMTSNRVGPSAPEAIEAITHGGELTLADHIEGTTVPAESHRIADFQSELDWLARLTGRDDLLDRLTSIFQTPHSGTGWIVLSGTAGIGKSALTRELLSQRERAGLPTICHFLRAGVAGWARPPLVAESLASQIETLIAADDSLALPPRERLARRVKQLAEHSGAPALLVVDGVDEAEDYGAETAMLEYLPDRFPGNVYLLVTARTHTAALAQLTRRETDEHFDLDLPRWQASNAHASSDLSSQFAHFSPTQFGPTPEKSPLQIVIEERWKATPTSPGDSPGPDASLEEVLDRIWESGNALHPETADERRRGLGLLCVTREPITERDLADYLDPAAAGELIEIAFPFLIASNDESEISFRFAHQHVRQWAQNQFRPAEVRDLHRALARGPRDADGEPLALTARRSRYLLQHRIFHQLEAGDLTDALATAFDIGRLTEQIDRIGISWALLDLAAVYTHVKRAELPGTAANSLSLLIADLEANFAAVVEAPRALASIVFNSLRRRAWPESEILETFDFTNGAPRIRLRQAMRVLAPSAQKQGKHSGPITNAIALADGQHWISASADQTLKVWNLRTGFCQRTLAGHLGPVTAIAASPNGSVIVSGSWDETVRVWRLDRSEPISVFRGHQRAISSVDLDLDHRLVVSGSWDRTVRIWDLDSGQTLHILRDFAAEVTQVRFAQDGQLFLVATSDGKFSVWRTSNGRTIAVHDDHHAGINAIDVDASGSRAITASIDQTIRIWDLERGECLHRLEGHRANVLTACLSVDGTAVYSAGWDRTLRAWDAETGELRQVTETKSPLTTLRPTRDGRHLVTACHDRRLTLWNTERWQIERPFEGATQRLHALTYSRETDRVFSIGSDGVLRGWDPESGEFDRQVAIPGRPIRTLAGNGSGTRLAGGGLGSRLWTFDAETPVAGPSLREDGGSIVAGEFLSDGALIIATDTGELERWSADGNREFTVQGCADEITAIAVDEDSKRAYAASWDGVIRVWHLESGEALGEIATQAGKIGSLEIVRSGALLVGGDDRTAQVWRPTDDGWRLDLRIDEHERAVIRFTELSDGSFLTVSRDETARRWDGATGLRIGAPIRLGSEPRAVAISAEANRLVTVGWDGVLRVAALPSGQRLATIDSPAGFTCAALGPDALFAGDGSGNLWSFDDAELAPPIGEPDPANASESDEAPFAAESSEPSEAADPEPEPELAQPTKP